MIKVVVPISGGKDSQACLKLALESYDKSEVMGLFCDTQFEHPLTYAHIDNMREMYGVKIERITAGSVPGQVLKIKRFPSSVARFCTDRLKLVPSKIFYKELAINQQSGFSVWLGMRANESKARSKRYKEIICTDEYPPHEVLRQMPKYLCKLGVSFRLPILEWSFIDVIDYLNGQENPLYKQGHDRVGCFPCLASSDTKKERDFNHDDFGREQRVIVAELEKKIGRSIWTSKGGAMRNNEHQDDIFTGCAICAI